MIKFSALTLVFTFIYYIVLELILVFTSIGTINTNFLFEAFIRLFAIWPAIATASSICFKNKKNNIISPFKKSLIISGIYFLLSIVLLLIPKPAGAYASTWILLGLLNFATVPVSFIVSLIYLKKYSK